METLAQRALVASILVLMALPGTAAAATVSVEPFVESPSVDPFGSCSRYMNCPPDMVVFTAADGENNQPVIAIEPAPHPRSRFVVRDHWAPVQAGAGCGQLDAQAVACVAGTLGPVELGDGDDWFSFTFGGGDVLGGEGRDVLSRRVGRMDGGGGDDILVGGFIKERTLADAIPQLVWTAQPDGYRDWHNRRWHEYTGVTPEQAALATQIDDLHFPPSVPGIGDAIAELEGDGRDGDHRQPVHL